VEVEAEAPLETYHNGYTKHIMTPNMIEEIRVMTITRITIVVIEAIKMGETTRALVGGAIE
jgi:hypothetical protein